MCVHGPVECEEGVPPRPHSLPSQAGRLHAQLSGELRDSDGSELIRLCCWCYACFIFADGGARFLSVYPFLYLFQSLLVSESLSRFPFLSRHRAVAVSCCCEGVLQAREAEFTVFNGRVTEDHT